MGVRGMVVDCPPRQLHQALAAAASLGSCIKPWHPLRVLPSPLARSPAPTGGIVAPLFPLPQIISPRNHMVFTPLIASSCVGTLEPRSVTVPITDIQPALRLPQNNFLVRLGLVQ